MMDNPLARRLEAERARKGVSLAAAAEGAGLSVGALQAAEQLPGRRPTVTTLGKLAKFYEIPVEELLRLRDE